MNNFVVIVFAFAVLTCISDDVIRPGNASLDTNYITLGTDSLLIFISQEDQPFKPRIGGRLIMQTQVSDSDDGQVLTRVERTFGYDGTLLNIDSFIVARASLAPLFQRSMGAEGEQILDLAKLTAPVFYSNSMDLILVSLPLKQGYEAQLAVFDGKTERVANVRVVDRASVATASGEKCVAWQIEVDYGENSGTYWVADHVRVLVRYVPTSQNMRIVRLHGCPARK